MPKPLGEMTREELWQLFPIVLKDYNPAYVIWYEQEKQSLILAVGTERIARISHIGSSAVAGLPGKPTVDILMEVASAYGEEELTHALRAAGWLLMSKENQSGMRMVFNKGYTPDGFAERVFHLHVRRPGDWDELYFRDYLLAHQEAAVEYGQLKRELLKCYEYDRDAYTDAKTPFIREITRKARQEFQSHYIPIENDHDMLNMQK